MTKKTLLIVKEESIAELYNPTNDSGIFTEYNYTQKEIYNLQSLINDEVYGYSIQDLKYDFFLYYNQNSINKYNLPNPATLWNNNEWTISAFNDLLMKAKEAMDKEEKEMWAIGGDYFTHTMGFVGARGRSLVEGTTLQLTDEQTIETIKYLQKN